MAALGLLTSNLHHLPVTSTADRGAQLGADVLHPAWLDRLSPYSHGPPSRCMLAWPALVSSPVSWRRT